MARRDSPPSDLPLETAAIDIKLAGLLDEIMQEETPEHLLELARRLQNELLIRKQRQTPS
ncbi:hypothetical protein [Aquamicrobium soli]|uniref:Anti-sigma factor NepR domain-containing protein n=1 Tax=Aquamicrobium soli TaxID=1811518 RepID=A0ABV7KB29_9HYPH